MNVLHYGAGKYNESLPQLKLVGNKIPTNSRNTMSYSWFNPINNKMYHRQTSDVLEIAIMTESKYNDLFDIKACVSKEENGYDYYGRLRDSEIAIRVTIDSDRIYLFREKSDSLRAYLSKLFETIPNYGISSHPKCDQKSFLPNDLPIVQPEGFKINLYDYQKKSIARMINIENNNSEMILNYKYTLDFNNLKISYDPNSKKFLKEDDNGNYEIKVSTKGGILADEMGLGKTITSLALVFMNPSRKNFNIDYSVPANYVNSYGKINAKSTLIVCPAHLAKQWETEVYKVFSDAKVIKLLTKNSHTPLKYKDIINADIIIVTQQFLMNFKYYPEINYRKCTPSNYGSDERKNALKSKMLQWVAANENIYEKKQPNLEHFSFHRLIVDEAHEIFGLQLTSAAMSEYMSDWLSICSADYKWFVSGTPFVNFSGVSNCLKFIDCQILNEGSWLEYHKTISSSYRSYGSYYGKDSYLIFQKKYMIDQLLNNVMIRHRKEDTDVNIIGYDEEINWVDLTEFEKKIYESKKNGNCNRILLQQICCHILATDAMGNLFDNKEVNLSEIEGVLIDHNKQIITKYENKLNTLVQGMQEYHMLKKMYESKISEAKFFLKIVEKITSEDDHECDENCSVCLDKIENRVMTKCGHMFCKDCLDMCLQVKKTCPYCKNDLKGSDIYLTSDMGSTKAEEETTNPLIQKYGSKLGKLISLARKLVIDEDNKLIIFSQWDRMLSLIGSALKENGVSNSFIQGNVYRRNAAINKFKTNNKEDNVIMLSLEKSASGTNLTEATHIIFVEPIDQSVDEVKAIESQAIARACRIGQEKKVKVIRILTRNTIEEEIYQKFENNNSNSNQPVNNIQGEVNIVV
jgi:SNF2 family DNA or RNA helicase